MKQAFIGNYRFETANFSQILFFALKISCGLDSFLTVIYEIINSIQFGIAASGYNQIT